MSETVSHWFLCPVKGCATVVRPTDRNWPHCFWHPVEPLLASEHIRDGINPLDLSDLAARGLCPMLREAHGTWNATAKGARGPWQGTGPTQAGAIAVLRGLIPDDAT